MARNTLIALKETSIMKKDDRRLRLGLLGCGPISQAAHLDAIRKARNADLYALCDIAVGLTDRLAPVYRPEAVYNDFAAMLADPQVEAVVIAVADQFHVPLCRQALSAGKPVLVEKPLGTTVEECEDLGEVLTLDAWYYDSVYRYTMQDNLYPVPIETRKSKRPPGDWKADRQRYILIT